jgi:hypothetical protein
MTLRDLSRMLGIHDATIGQGLARGRTDWKHLPAVAKILDVPLEWLAYGENPPTWAAEPARIDIASIAAALHAAGGGTPGRGVALDSSRHYDARRSAAAASDRDDLVEELRSLRAVMSAQTEVMTELLRKCRKIDDMAEQLDRLEDRGPGLGGAADDMPARKRGGA